MNRAKELFQELQDVGAIQALIDSRESEDTWLEFKTVDPDLNKKDHCRKNFSKAISAFGNTDGGVLVWGISSPSSDKGEARLKLQEIQDAEAFAAELNKWISRATFPPHSGVRNHPIIMDRDTKRGVVVSYIPPSPRRPLQSQCGKGFFMRAGESSVELPYQLLAGMFGKAPHPDIRVKPFLCIGYSTGGAVRPGLGRAAPVLRIYITLDVENISSIAARDAYLTATLDLEVDKYVKFNFLRDDGLENFMWLQREHRCFLTRPTATAILRDGFILAPSESSHALQIRVDFAYQKQAYDIHSFTLQVDTGATKAIPHRLEFSIPASLVNEIEHRMHENSQDLWEFDADTMARVMTSNLEMTSAIEGAVEA